MKTFDDVPAVIRQGAISVSVGGQQCEIMAFLAGPREDGAVLVADDIFEKFGDGDPRREPSRYIEANAVYLDELAAVSKCEVKNLIGLRPDGRYWCVHQVGVNYGGWLNKRVQVALERAAIEFAKERMARAFEWIDKRSLGTQTVQYLSSVIDEEVDDPSWGKKGAKYGIIHAAVQGPINKALGGPESTRAFKEVNKADAAMDVYDTPWLNAVNLARSVTGANIKRKKLRDVREAADEGKRVSVAYADITKKLLDQ